MTNEQMNFIREQLKFHGFPQVDTEYLQKFSGSTEFELTVQVWFGKDRVEAILLFRLSEHYGVHFLHRHTVTLRARSQTFYLFKNKGITLKEAYNLLCGRAVFKKQQSKEQQVYHVWLQLDLNEPDEDGYVVKRYFENYGFDIVAALNAISLSNENKWERAMIIRSLERGNLQPVLLASGKAWIMANPRFKTIDIHQDITPVKPKKETDNVEDIFKNNKSGRKRIPIK